MKKLLVCVAVVTVVLIGVEKYFAGPSAPVFDYSGEPNSDQFVHDNLLATLYHEIGHAMIDQLELPLLGQEEDAADVASVFLIDALYEEEAAIEITYAAADMFLALAEETGEPYWASTHGPDLQRYYNLACLFAGADMDARARIGEDLGVKLNLKLQKTAGVLRLRGLLKKHLRKASFMKGAQKRCLKR